MSKIIELKHLIYDELKLPSGKKRRQVLISEMSSLADQKIDCLNCSGTCCTFSANSMQITPIEAFEMLLSLDLNQENIETIKIKLQKNVVDFRLNHEIFLGRKNNSFLRKTYTCPFFNPGPKGCTIKKDLKPYGCLGFNPKMEGDNGSRCLSNIELLESREKEQIEAENAINARLAKELNLNWTKLEIPKALLALIEKIFL